MRQSSAKTAFPVARRLHPPPVYTPGDIKPLEGRHSDKRWNKESQSVGGETSEHMQQLPAPRPKCWTHLPCRLLLQSLLAVVELFAHSPPH